MPRPHAGYWPSVPGVDPGRGAFPVSGYTPVFGSLFQGSLCGQWPALAVFCTLLPLADKNGCLDFSFGYLSAVTGWPEDLLREGVFVLEAPDPASRNPDDDGRRLVRLRDNTDWGWRIVNHGYYREKARKAAFDSARAADGRNAERMRERRNPAASVDDPRRPDATRDDPPSNANTDADGGQLRSDSGSTLSASESERARSEALFAQRARKSEKVRQLASAAVKGMPR